MFITLALSVALTAPVPKGVSTELKWKFAKGGTFYVTYEHEGTAKVDGLNGTVATTNWSMVTVIYKMTVTTVDEKGVTLEMEFLSAKGASGTAGNKPADLDDQPAVVGKKVTLTLDKDHNVTKAVGADEVAAVGGPVGDMYKNDSLKLAIKRMVRSVPGKTLGKGDKWTEKDEWKLPDGMSAKSTDRGTVVGTEDGLTKLEVESDQVWSGDNVGGQKVAIQLKGDKGKRAVLFDVKAGRVRKVEDAIELVGTIILGGCDTQTINITAALKVTVTVSDTEPKATK